MTANQAKAIARQCAKRAFFNQVVEIIECGLVPVLNGHNHRIFFCPSLKQIDLEDAWHVFIKRGGELCAESMFDHEGFHSE